ncbi:MAG: pilus assembly protein TadG-related protein [Acidimicrobiia bacterium]
MMPPVRPIPRRAHDDDGYVLVMAALLLVPLLLFAAFAVDVGAWYTQGNKIQRAADAAALAGAVWMPDFTQASSVALATAAKNGFPTGGQFTVTPATVPGNPHALKVSIRDSKAQQVFSQLVMANETIARSAIAEYSPAIPLGSPTNYFGTGSLNSGSAPVENFWAAVSGYCAAKENGDLRLTGFDNASGGRGYDCNTSNGAITNTDYRASGYLYSIEIPASAPPSVAVQVYDAGYNSGSTPNPDSELVRGATIDTTYVIRDTGSTFAPLTHAALVTRTIASDDTSWAGWQTIGTINNPCAGCTYYLQVFTKAGQSHSEGSNGFGLRIANGGLYSPCSTIVGSTSPPYSASCVQIHGREDMSIFANLSGSTASFYLADIGAKYAGKKLKISLFDIGEGATLLELLDPNGNPVHFDWSTKCGGGVNPATTCSGTNVVSLDPSLQRQPQPYPRTSSSYVFNDRTIDLVVTLPSNYAAVYGTNSWWKVRYSVGAAPTDRTTWSATIIGTPVHLVGGR